jgi:dethiobiotin synthetase/adenosylmethionine--8-amino-7-oxononanoate aminotransferase
MLKGQVSSSNLLYSHSEPAKDVTGYNSTAALGLHKALLRSDGYGWTIHSRVLGNILYLMASLTTQKATLRSVETRLLEELETQA